MKQLITYGITKTYKGVFTKRHMGNVQFLVIPGNSTFMVFNLLGRLEDGREASQMILRMSGDFMDSFLNQFKQEENFVPVEEIPCKVKEKGGNNYTVVIPKKGKYIRSDLEITFEPEFSSGNIHIYFIDGKISLIKDIDINGRVQLKMAAASQRAKAIDILKKFTSKLSR